MNIIISTIKKRIVFYAAAFIVFAIAVISKTETIGWYVGNEHLSDKLMQMERIIKHSVAFKGGWGDLSLYTLRSGNITNSKSLPYVVSDPVIKLGKIRNNREEYIGYIYKSPYTEKIKKKFKNKKIISVMSFSSGLMYLKKDMLDVFVLSSGEIPQGFHDSSVSFNVLWEEFYHWERATDITSPTRANNNVEVISIDLAPPSPSGDFVLIHYFLIFSLLSFSFIKKKHSWKHIIHDIKNNLLAANSLIESYELGQKEKLKAKKIITEISFDVDALLSRNEKDFEKKSSNNKPVDIVAEIRTETNKFESLATLNGIYLRYHANVEQCISYVDEERLKKIIANFITNALKNTKSGGVDVSLIMKDDSVEISVFDTGCGIKDGGLDKLLKSPFYSDEREKFGLQSCKEYVKKLNGKMMLMNHHDGFVAIIEIPINSYSTQNKYPVANTILVLEDCIITAKLIEKNGVEQGINIITCDNTSSACILWDRLKPGVVLVDGYLGCGHGSEFVSYIRRKEGDKRGTYIIAMSNDRSSFSESLVDLFTSKSEVLSLLNMLNKSKADH